jgi:SAM-dependent methyltransferase
LERGYEVVAFDGSQAMAREASRLTGRDVAVLRFCDVPFVGEFDGIWACASLLHVPRPELAFVFERLRDAMRPGGILYASFKLGERNRFDGGRHFTDFTPRSFEKFAECIPDLTIERLWQTSDLRPAGAGNLWVNVLLRKGNASGCHFQLERCNGPRKPNQRLSYTGGP